EQALRHAPRDPEALLAAAPMCRARGGQADLAAFAERFRAQNPDVVELEEALADEALYAGRPDEAVALLQRAAGGQPRGEQGLRLAQALLASGQVEPARALAESLMSEVPEAGL